MHTGMCKDIYFSKILSHLISLSSALPYMISKTILIFYCTSESTKVHQFSRIYLWPIVLEVYLKLYHSLLRYNFKHFLVYCPAGIFFKAANWNFMWPYFPNRICWIECYLSTHCHCFFVFYASNMKYAGLPSGNDPPLPVQETQVPSLGLEEDPLEEKWQSPEVFLPSKSHGQRSLLGYSPWGCKRVGQD